MLDSNTILGVRGYLNCEEYEHGILVQNWESWPLGAPVVFQAGALEGSTTSLLSLITPAQQAGGTDSTNIYSKNVAPVNLKPLCKNHKVLTVSQFDIEKFNRLTEFVHDVGGISLVIKYKGGRKNLAERLQKLSSIFKYSVLFYYNAWGGVHLSGKDDVYACVLTFLDLPYCIPLFNTHRVDGIGLSISGAVENQSISGGMLHRTFRSDIIYSNYADNLLVIDGVSINNNDSLSDSIFKEIANFATKELKEGPPVSKKENRSTDSSGYKQYMMSSNGVELKDENHSIKIDYPAMEAEVLTVGTSLEAIEPSLEVETTPDDDVPNPWTAPSIKPSVAENLTFNTGQPSNVVSTGNVYYTNSTQYSNNTTPSDEEDH